jgi:ligand-binding sensor domain-containing protein
MARFGYVILLFIPFSLSGQSFTPNPDWRFENFNSQNHFISSEIINIAIDKKGYIWTSGSGIQRFDGYKTLNFNSFEPENGGLKSNNTDVAVDNYGRVWINSAGICYYDDAQEKFIYVQPDPKRKINGAGFMAIHGDFLWFVGEYGLTKLNVRSLEISYTSLKYVDNPLGNFFIDDNTLLVSSREKVYIYNIKNDTYTTNTFIYKHSLLKVFAVATKDKTIFLGTTRGLFTLNNLKDISPVSNGTGDIVEDLLFMPQDKEKKYLFIAKEGNGLFVYNTEKKKMEFAYVHDDNNPYSLLNNIISRLLADKDGKLWIATGSGISMLDVTNQQWKMRFMDKININKIARDKYDSTRVWMSSYTNGMICMNWRTKQVQKIYDLDPEMHDIYDFAQVAPNKWLLVTPQKIMEWSPQSGIYFREKVFIPDSISLRYNINRIIMADANTCFITTALGLFKYDLSTHKITPVSVYNRGDKKADPLQYLLLDGFNDHGTLWITSRGGLFSYNIAKNETKIYRGKGDRSDYFFNNIASAPNNRIVCADVSGINIFNRDTKNFEIIHTIGRLQRPVCVSVLSVGKKVWIGSEAGILNYDLDTHKFEKAEHENPLMQISPGSQFSFIGSDIVMGYPNGYVYFTPGPEKSLAPSDPVIERVFVNNQPILRQYGSADGPKKTIFRYSENSINIAFTAFLFTDPNYIKFRYRLKGADPKWQYAQDQRSANYAQLEPGDYTFYVQSGNKAGSWNNHLASFSFVIMPPYWETWWFRGLLVLLLAFILYRLYLYRIKNILAIERIRERIASDFHDDIGSALSSISIFSEVADKQLKQQAPPEQTREIISHISLQARTMLDAMDDIIWMVNPQNDHFNDLAVRMREYAIPLLEARNIQFDIHIQENVLSSPIKMGTRKNIFLIFKECINNILKHADCSAMKVEVNKLNNQVELVISDNGKGFDIDAPSSRNGLKNMQKRAAEINGTIKVTTGPCNGTITRLLVNII